jgi:hypothetical protein
MRLCIDIKSCTVINFCQFLFNYSLASLRGEAEAISFYIKIAAHPSGARNDRQCTSKLKLHGTISKRPGKDPVNVFQHSPPL